MLLKDKLPKINLIVSVSVVCFIFVINASAVSVVVVDADIGQLVSFIGLLLNCFVNLFFFVFFIHVHSTVSLHYAL